ncbi:MAG: hypothetical protein HRT89_16225, partial [Lentisphaeria bacterium]|nr:hypothetical protein [Lentisphaeria bacterium]
MRKYYSHINIAIALILYIILILPILKGEFYSSLDFDNQVMHWRSFSSLALEENKPGIWNPYLLRGYSMLGEGQGGILHPDHIVLYKLFPLKLALSLELALVFPFCFLGGYLLLRRFNCKKYLAISGATAISLSSFALVHYQHINMLWVYAHLPLLLYFVDRFFKSEHYKNGVFILILIASMIFIGSPQMTWLCALAVCLFILFNCATKRYELTKRKIAILGLSSLAAVLIGMMQLVPTYDYLENSNRSETSNAYRNSFSVHPASYIYYLSPYSIDKQGTLGDILEDKNYTITLENYAYPGAVLFFIVLCALVFHKEKDRKYWLALSICVLLILLASGRYTGLNNLMAYMPLVGKFQAPVRYTSILNIFFVIAGILFLNRLTDKSFNKRVFILPIIILSFFLILALSTSEIRLPFIDRIVSFELNSFACIMLGPLVILIISFLLYKHNKNTELSVFIISLFISVECFALVYMHYTKERTNLDTLKQIKQDMKKTAKLYRHYDVMNAPALQGHYQSYGYLGLAPKEKLSLYSTSLSPKLLIRNIRLSSTSKGNFKNDKGEDSVVNIPNCPPRFRLVQNLTFSEDSINDS